MKIVYLLASTGLSGGAKVVFQQAEELARRGHSVTTVSPEPPPAWIRLVRARHETAEFRSSAALREADVVIATFWTTIAPAAESGRGVLFHLCQGIEEDTGFYAAERAAIASAYRKIPRKLAVSPHLVSALERRGFAGAVDVGQAFEAGEYGAAARIFDRDPLRVLVPGLFEIDVKGVREALEALRRLRAHGSDFRVVRVSLEPMSGEEKKIGVVDEYHARVPPGRMPALLASVDVFLGPNHETEGFGLPSLEALAAGLPAVLSDTPSHRAIAGDAALFFPARDVAAMIGSLGRILSEERTRRRLSSLGPARAARFRTSDVAERLEAVFASALDERRRSAPSASHA